MIEFIEYRDNPELLLITPLRFGDTIMDKTINSITNNKTSFHWIKFEGDGNPYKNMDTALKIYLKTRHMPKYVMKMDNDIIAKEGMLDKMFDVLETTEPSIAYTYCSFEFTGFVNVRFDAREFDDEMLCRSNYISSMSMIKSKALEDIGGVITDDKYYRLLDWALWLKFLNNGYIGKPVYDTFFTAIAGKNSVSAGSNEDYQVKAQRIYNDFIKPYLNLKMLKF